MGTVLDLEYRFDFENRHCVLSPSDLNNAVYFGSFTMSKTFGWINMDGMLETK